MGLIFSEIFQSYLHHIDDIEDICPLLVLVVIPSVPTDDLKIPDNSHTKEQSEHVLDNDKLPNDNDEIPEIQTTLVHQLFSISTFGLVYPGLYHRVPE